MSRLTVIACLAFLFAFVTAADTTAPQPPAPAGPYVGQTTPGDEPVLFAPGIVSTALYTRDIAMTPDGRELYFCVSTGGYSYSVIAVTRLVDGRWTVPEVAPFSADPAYKYAEPCITPDGRQFFFASNRPAGGGPPREHDWDLWVMDRAGDGWGEPRNLGAPVNTSAGEYFPSVTRDGTLYFTRTDAAAGTNFIYRARRSGEGFAEPEKLPAPVNAAPAQFNALVAPDESFLILPIYGRPDSCGGTDYYILFRKADGSWGEPIHLGPPVSSKSGEEYSPALSPDGKYFFFMSARPAAQAGAPGGRVTLDFLRRTALQPGCGNPAIYWMKASFIERLRPKAE
jgi:hypothetical protein